MTFKTYLLSLPKSKFIVRFIVVSVLQKHCRKLAMSICFNSFICICYLSIIYCLTNLKCCCTLALIITMCNAIINLHCFLLIECRRLIAKYKTLMVICITMICNLYSAFSYFNFVPCCQAYEKNDYVAIYRNMIDR